MKKHYSAKSSDVLRSLEHYGQRLRRLFKTGPRGKREIKDILFRKIFEEDRKALLDLYNALNGSSYSNVDDLIIVTLEDSIYLNVKNDLAFIIQGTLNLFEHQSTYSDNLPIRFFIYLADEYQKILKTMDQSIYGEAMIKLPTPVCIVFYNGLKDEPDSKILRLSDAFLNEQTITHTELEVKLLNINYGHNRELMSHCQMLKEYSECVHIIRQFTAKEPDKEKAIADALDHCIDNNILRDFILKHRNEVLGMLVDEFEIKKYERTLKQEGYNAGFSMGELAGISATKQAIAIKLIEKKTCSIEEIAAITGLSTEEIIKLQQ